MTFEHFPRQGYSYQPASRSDKELEFEHGQSIPHHKPFRTAEPVKKIGSDNQVTLSPDEVGWMETPGFSSWPSVLMRSLGLENDRSINRTPGGFNRKLPAGDMIRNCFSLISVAVADLSRVGSACE